MLPTHPVPCPHCGQPLFAATSLDDGVNAQALDAPALEQDARGEYMRCPHCAARVDMVRIRRDGAEEVQPAPGPRDG